MRVVVLRSAGNPNQQKYHVALLEPSRKQKNMHFGEYIPYTERAKYLEARWHVLAFCCHSLCLLNTSRAVEPLSFADRVTRDQQIHVKKWRPTSLPPQWPRSVKGGSVCRSRSQRCSAAQRAAEPGASAKSQGSKKNEKRRHNFENSTKSEPRTHHPKAYSQT